MPLAAITDPDFVLPAIAQALGERETGSHSLLELDNFEQVLAAAPSLSDLLTTCPNLRLLVSSRASLHLLGEHEFPVSPLPLPDLAHLPAREALSHYAALSLFVQRAQAIKPDFQLTEANARTIAEICTRLDGLPLAIELPVACTRRVWPCCSSSRSTKRTSLLVWRVWQRFR